MKDLCQRTSAVLCRSFSQQKRQFSFFLWLISSAVVLRSFFLSVLKAVMACINSPLLSSINPQLLSAFHCSTTSDSATVIVRRASGFHVSHVVVLATPSQQQNGQQVSKKDEQVLNENQQVSVVAKQMPHFEDQTALDSTLLRICFKREIQMYEKYLPLLNTKIYEESLIFENLYPKIIKTSSLMSNDWLMMQDVRCHGFQRINSDFLNLEESLAGVEALSKLHSLSFILKKEKPEVFARIAAECKDEFHKKILHSLLPTLSDQLRRHGSYFNHLSLKSSTSEACAVICHGDPWIPNLMIKRSNNPENEKTSKNYGKGEFNKTVHPQNEVDYYMVKVNDPSIGCIDLSTEINDFSILLLDWQLSHFASPAIDLSFFIYVNCKVDNDGEVIDHLLLHYYNRLAFFIENSTKKENYTNEEFKSIDIMNFSFDQLLEQMRRYAVFGVVKAVQLLPLLLKEKYGKNYKKTNKVEEKTVKDTKINCKYQKYQTEKRNYETFSEINENDVKCHGDMHEDYKKNFVKINCELKQKEENGQNGGKVSKDDELEEWELEYELRLKMIIKDAKKRKYLF